MPKKKRKESSMPSGFEQNVAVEMPRSGRGSSPKTPWDVPPSSADAGSHLGLPVRPARRRPATFERGRSDVLQKIRELKAELEGSFSAREDLQGKVEGFEQEIRRLREEAAALKEALVEQKRDTTYQKEEKESLQKKAKELDGFLHQERIAKEELQAELAESRMALQEINEALQ